MEQSVADYALEAGISERRVRALAESGQIVATKYGTSWVISEPSVLYAKHRQGSGRPLNEQGAWDLALILDGHEISSPYRSRARQRAETLRNDAQQHGELTVESTLMRWLSSRATRHFLRAVIGDIDDIRADPRLHPTGVSHPDSGLLQAREYDAYVLASDYNDVVDGYLLIDTSPARANVTLRVIHNPEPPTFIPRMMIAMDLLERTTPREVTAARTILTKALSDNPSGHIRIANRKVQ